MHQVLHKAVALQAAATHHPTLYDAQTLDFFHALGAAFPYLIGGFVFLWLFSLRHSPQKKNRLHAQAERDYEVRREQDLDYYDRLTRDLL